MIYPQDSKTLTRIYATRKPLLARLEVSSGDRRLQSERQPQQKSTIHQRIMTYNFDPDKWYDMEHGYLKARLKSGKITKEDYNRAVEELERQHADIWKRLDGT